MAKALKANPDEMVEAVTWPSGPSRSSANQFRCSDIWGGAYYYCLVLAGSAESLENMAWRSATGCMSKWARAEEGL